jgi:hypothetical protein
MLIIFYFNQTKHKFVAIYLPCLKKVGTTQAKAAMMNFEEKNIKGYFETNISSISECFKGKTSV